MTKPEALQLIYRDAHTTALTYTGRDRFRRALRALGFTPGEMIEAEQDAEYRNSDGTERELKPRGRA
jgi:hypothetical protein